MAITYLSGQRVQGVSANSSSSWTSNTADWSYSSSGYLDFATIHRSETSQEIYLDLQDFLGGSNLSDSSWVVRLGKFTTGTLSSGNVLLYIGFTNNNGADSGETQQTIVTAFNFNSSAGAINVIGTADSIESGDEADTVYSDLDASTDYYVEMKRDGNDFTVTAYEDEYSSSLGTATITKSGLSGLRYFKAFNNSEQSGNSATGSKFYGDVQIYDAQTSATTLTKTITLADDKSTVTDVPAGSQFEETNTRKFYQRSADSTTRALGDVVWDASESQDATISGNDVYFDNGNYWDAWSRSTDTFTMGAGTATIIWKLHSIVTGSSSAHTMVGFGKNPISSSSMMQ